ncbi:MAG: stage II sporulation protein M [bacterium]|nr:stage II sporulation protein M [bacterium]
MATTVNEPMKPLVAQPAGRWDEARRTLSNALIITRREVRDSFRDWRIVGPIIILTFVFPFLAQWVAARFSGFLATYGAEIIGERTIPFLLMIVGFFPISISLVIALETFVGEKERRSLEPLLSTPLTNTELYIGKTLAAMIPPLIASIGGMLVYLGTLLFSELAWRPQPMLIVQIILLTIVQALVMVTGAVVVSSQTTSTRAANLLASFIIIPMTLIINGESIIIFLAPDANSSRGVGALWAIIVGMLVVVVLLLRVGNSIFNREELLGRTIDRLDLRGILAKAWRHARAVDENGTPARSLVEWYTRAIPLSLRRLRVPVAIAVLVFLGAFVGGLVFGLIPRWQIAPYLPPPEQFSGTSSTLASFLNLSVQGDAMLMIFTQNTRVLLAALMLSMFSFGVAALVLTPLTFVILGYITGQVLIAGYSPLLILGAVVTHGIVEIPMIVIATAIALRLGAVITRPPSGNTVGHAWIVTLGDTLKLVLGVVLPGLLLAAFLESFITPRVVLALLGG